MSVDAAIPEKFWPAIRWVLSHVFSWVLPLIGAERIADEHYVAGAVFFVLSVVVWIISAKWDRIAELVVNRGRSLLTWGLIVVGAGLLAFGVARLAFDKSSAPPSAVNGSDLAKQLSAAQKDREAMDRQLAATRRELQELQSKVAASGEQNAKSGFTDKTVRQLRSYYEGRTALQAEPFIAPEKGKLIDVDGKVVMVHSGMAFLTTLQNESDSVECWFAPTWNSRLANYGKGDILKIRGTIAATQNGAQIYLDKCEIRD